MPTDTPDSQPSVGSYTIKALSLKLQRYIDARRSISLDFEFFHQFMPSTHTLSESSDCCLRQTQTVSALSILHQQPGNKTDSTATKFYFGLRKKLSHPGGLWPPRLYLYSNQPNSVLISEHRELMSHATEESLHPTTNTLHVFILCGLKPHSKSLRL